MLQCARSSLYSGNTSLITLTLALLAALALFAARLPRPLRSRYLAAFEARHGIGVIIGLTVLATVVVATLIGTLVRPGHAAAELVNAMAVAALAAAAVLDLLAFIRRGH